MDSREKLSIFANAYKISSVIFVAVRLNLFKNTYKEISLRNLAKELNVLEQPLALLVNFLVALGILKESYGNYIINNDYLPLLFHDNELVMQDFIKIADTEMENRNYTKELMDSMFGKSSKQYDSSLKLETVKNFNKVLNNSGQYASVLIARELSRYKPDTILDIGGNVGTYAIGICKILKSVTVDVYDIASMKAPFEENVSKHGLKDRIKFFEKDIMFDKIDQSYDAIILSNLLHCFPISVIDFIISKVSQAIRSGGVIILHDTFLDESGTTPLQTLLHNLDWLTSGCCFNYTAEDMRDKFEQYGLKLLKKVKYKNMPTTILVLKK